MATRKELIAWLIIFCTVLLWSVINPHDLFTWFLEVLPALIGLAILAMTRKRFPLTRLTYWLILLHAVILMVGGHYTYAEVPLFNWLRDGLDMGRNNYDKFAHFVQGFVPAIIGRELLLRRSPLAPGKWLTFIVVCICLAISAFYEIIEWWVAAASGSDAVAFLGTQGYVWDTQSDMLLALIGAICGLLLLSSRQDLQLQKLEPSPFSSIR